VIGSFASSVFLVVVAGTLERLGIPIAFVMALLATMLIQGCSFWFMQRRMNMIEKS